MAKTVVALYDDVHAVRQAIEALKAHGILNDQIGLLAVEVGDERDEMLAPSEVAHARDISAGEGAGIGAIFGALVGLGVSTIPGIGLVLGAGPLAAALAAGIGAAAGAATGSITAALIDMGASPDQAAYFAEGVRRGSILLSVVVDDEKVEAVQDMMNRHNPVDIDLRAAEWRREGWQGFALEAERAASEQIQWRRAQRSDDLTVPDGVTPDVPVEPDRELGDAYDDVHFTHYGDTMQPGGSSYERDPDDR
ncbi:MAG: hypothetical protein SNJ59_02710 [Aggregatilineales bacterium]